MKQIKGERIRIEAYMDDVGCAEFFNLRQYKEDLEWLLLAYLTDALSAAGWETPEYAEKLMPPEPDFQTFLNPGTPFRRIEATEAMRPGYRRGEFYRKLAKSGRSSFNIPPPHPHPWSSFLEVLRCKLAKPYASGSWLLIYYNPGAFQFNDSIPWFERVLCELRTWSHDSDTTCDITQSRYESIFVVNGGGHAVRLHPHWDVVKAADVL